MTTVQERRRTSAQNYHRGRGQFIAFDGTGGSTVLVRPDHIVWIEEIRGELHVHLVGGQRLIVNDTIEELLQEIGEYE